MLTEDFFHNSSLHNIWDGIPTPPSNDIWHDTLFQVGVLAFITLLAATPGGIISYWLYRKGLERKEITYRVLYDTYVLRVDEEVKSKMNIEFDGQKVEAMSVVVLKVLNSGNKSVTPQDFIDPITFKFEGRKVLDVSIESMEPKSLIKLEDIKKYLEDNRALPQSKNDTLRLPEMHLNSEKRTRIEESITLKVLLSGSENSISVEGRIDDGRIIAFVPTSKELPFAVGLLFLLLLALFVIDGVLAILNPASLNFTMQYIFFTTIATVLLMFQVYWRFIHPFHCTCGYQTIFARRMFRHLQIGFHPDQQSARQE